MVNRGGSLKAPQWNINKEKIVVIEVSSLVNGEKRIYYEEQAKNILKSFKKKLP